MAITINLAARRKTWEMDLSTLPVERVETGAKVLGLFLVVFSLIWGGAPILGFVQDLQEGGLRPESFLFLIFPTIGAGILLLGVRSLLWRRRIAFDGQEFTVEERGLRGATRWREPLSAFRGVLRHSRDVRTKDRSYTLYMIDLVHPNKGRGINLYTSTSERGFREKWEAFARRLALPALEDGVAGVVRREADDLDKSVGELIDEGKVDIDYDILARPTKGLAVSFEGDTVVLTRTGPISPWWGSLIAVLFPLVFVGVALFVPDMPTPLRWLFAGLGALFEVLVMVGVLIDLLSRQRLRVGPEGVRVNRAYARSEAAGKSLVISEIETVTIARKSSGSRPALVIAADRETLNFGRGLPGWSLEFTMNTVLAKVAEVGRRQRR